MSRQTGGSSPGHNFRGAHCEPAVLPQISREGARWARERDTGLTLRRAVVGGSTSTLTLLLAQQLDARSSVRSTIPVTPLDGLPTHDQGMEEHAHLERLPGSIAIPLTLVAQRGTAWSRFWGMPSTLMAISLFGKRSGIPRCRLPRDDVLHRKQLNSIINRLGFVLAHQPTAAETRKWSPGRGCSRRPPVPGAALL
jgi:hypothetical protein